MHTCECAYTLLFTDVHVDSRLPSVDGVCVYVRAGAVCVPAVRCCPQEECVMGISFFSWLLAALLQICSRCVWLCVCVL